MENFVFGRGTPIIRNICNKDKEYIVFTLAPPFSPFIPILCIPWVFLCPQIHNGLDDQ